MTIDMTLDHPVFGARRLPGLAELRDDLVGEFVTPADRDWAVRRLPWNVAVQAEPAAVLFAATPEDVSTVVRYAATHGYRISPQAGGHGATAEHAGTIVVRTTGLDDIWIDATARVAKIGAGVKWGALQEELDGTGLTGLIGSNPDVSVVGFSLQGGYSWFTREFGTGSGALRAVEIVDDSGRRRWIDDRTDPELMWALRGGGGRFGVVTAAEIDLFPVDEFAGGRLMFPIETAPALFSAFAEASEAVPSHVSLWASALHFPDLPEIPEPVRGESFCVIDAVTTRGLDELSQVLEPFRAAGPVVHDTVRRRTPGEIGDICEEPTDPTPGLVFAVPLGRLTDAAIGAIIDAATRRGPFLQFQVRDLTGAPGGRDGVGATTTAGYLLSVLAITPFPEAAAAAEHAARELQRAFAPWTSGRLLPTFLAPWQGLADAYAPGERERLAAIEAAVDPAGRFAASVRAG